MNAAQEREILMDEREQQFDALIREYLMDNGTTEFGDGRRFRNHGLQRCSRCAYGSREGCGR